MGQSSSFVEDRKAQEVHGILETEGDYHVTRVYSKIECYSACVESLTGLEGYLPICFAPERWNWTDQIVWLRQHGWNCVEHKLLPGSMQPPTPGINCILSGVSPRPCKYKHSVVARTCIDGFDIIHDPFDAESNLPYALKGDPEIVTWLFK